MPRFVLIRVCSRWVFVETESEQVASAAIRLMDGVMFDKRYQMHVNRFTDIEKLASLSDEYVEPKVDEFVPREHARWWLSDPQTRDQLVMMKDDLVTLMWYNRTGNPTEIEQRKRWTESYLQWSPQGTYLATFRVQGVALFSGPKFSFKRFAHPGVSLVDFSPDEKYMVTWSPQPIHVPEGMLQGPEYFAPRDEGNRVAVWDVSTGHLLSTFPVEKEDLPASAKANGTVLNMPWPFLKWSGDGKYCARIQPGKRITVYELPTMQRLDKKSIDIEGVVDFEWCPLGDKDKDQIDAWDEAQRVRDEEAEYKARGEKYPNEKALQRAKAAKKPRDNMLVYWVPEVDNQPARVAVMSIPERQIVRTKNLFNVSDCKLHWHPQGDYLCVKVDRHTKTKKSIFTNLELFKTREKNFPVDTLELKEPVTAFAWEPMGSHFAAITTNNPAQGAAPSTAAIRSQITLFYLDQKKGDFKLLKVLDNTTANTLFWSPKGRHLVAATMGSASKSDLQWYDVDFGLETRQGQPANDPSEEVRKIGEGEHVGMTDLEWDPSGRYVITSGSVWRQPVEHGYAIWDWKGKQLQQHHLDRFKQILWRPRPRLQLSKEEQKEVRRNLREMGKQFDEEDAAEESNAALRNKELYERKLREWHAWHQGNLSKLNEKREAYGLSAVVPVQVVLEQEQMEDIQEWMEEVVSETVEPVE